LPLARQSLWRRRAEKNREIFGILNSHNLLSARRLQKNDEASIYNNAENRENFDILNSHNMLLSARCLPKKANTSIYKGR
jgi:hypothetical protein